MKILSKLIYQCERCGYYWGFVDERYNEIVPVFCHCDLISKKASQSNPAILGLPGEMLVWRPISDHKEADGKYWHSPYFALGSGLPTPKWQKEEEEKNSN